MRVVTTPQPDSWPELPNLVHRMTLKPAQPFPACDLACEQYLLYFRNFEEMTIGESLNIHPVDWLFPADQCEAAPGSAPLLVPDQMSRLLHEPGFAARLLENYRWFLMSTGMLRSVPGEIHFDRRHEVRISHWSKPDALCDLAFARVIRCMHLAEFRGQWRDTQSDLTYAEWLYHGVAREIVRVRGAVVAEPVIAQLRAALED